MIPGPASVLPEGGEAHLEADVMRFVAILALCLVAISTLVSAPPPAPVASPAPPARPVTAAAPRPAAGPPRSEEPASPAPSPAPITPGGGDAALRLPDPEPARPPAAPAQAAPAPSAADPGPDPEPTVAPAPRPAPEPAPASRPAPEPAPAAAAPAPRGFVLRFESDAALLRLAAAGRVGVYALRGDGALRLRLGAAGAEMVPGPMPASFHVMDPATVPTVLRRALPGSAGADAPTTWAVTLPGDSRRRLAELMRRYEDGELVIAADGGVRRLARED